MDASTTHQKRLTSPLPLPQLPQHTNNWFSQYPKRHSQNSTNTNPGSSHPLQPLQQQHQHNPSIPLPLPLPPNNSTPPPPTTTIIKATTATQQNVPQPITKQIEFPSYSSVLDIRMPTSDGPSSFRSVRNLSHVSESDVRRKTDSNHPFHKLHHQPTYLSDHQSIHSNRQLALDRHKKSARQPRVYPNHPLNVILCCHAKYPGSARPSLSIPLTRRATQEGRELGQTPNNTSELDPTTHPSKKKVYLPLQTIVSAGLLIAIPSLFIYSTALDLINYQRIIGNIILAVFSYVWLISLSSMIKTVTSDPGILPRGLDPNPEMQWKPAEEDALKEEQQGYSQPPTLSPSNNALQHAEEKQPPLEVGEWELLPRWIKVETFKPKPSESKARLERDKLDQSLGLSRDHRIGWVQSKWCTSCETYRPPRSSHCRICDCCIDGIDHHCSYLNNCIGSKNYRSFFVFLLTSSADLMIMIGCSIWKLFILKHSTTSSINENHDSSSSESISVLDSLKSHPIDIVIIGLSILIFIPIFALTGYHVFLTCNGLTTIEYIKAQTTKKVIKESARLVDQFYSNGNPQQQQDPEHAEEMKRRRSFGAKLLSKLTCGKTDGSSPNQISHSKSLDLDHHHEQQQQQRRSNNFVIGRLCRPDTEAFIDWNSLI